MSGAPAPLGSVLPTLLRERARLEPERVYLQHVDGPTLTFGELEALTRAWMTELHGHGVRAGDTVAVLLPPCFDAIALWMAVARLGAIEVPLNSGYVGTILGHALEEVRPRVLVTNPMLADRLNSVTEPPAELETVLVIGADAPPPLPRRAVVATLDGDGSGIEPVEPQRHDLATILFTSGTTGRSKGVAVPWAQAEATARWHLPLESLSADDVWYSPWPLFHVSGRLAVYQTALLGAKLVLRESFSTTRFWADVRATGATTALIIAATVSYLQSQPPSSDDADHTLRNVFIAPIPADADAFAERFGVRLCTVFNMTELSCPIVSGWGLGPGGSCGRVRPGAHCRIVDANDREVPHGELGELVVRMDEPWEVMSGYWRRPEATVAAWRNLWFHTGDLARRDADGNFYFVDRLKDAIRRRGENISSLELEAEVNAHPDVLESAAIGVPSSWGEEDIKVFVVPRPDASFDPAELVAFLTERVPRFMLPRYVAVVSDIAKTANTRAKKAELRAREQEPCWDRESDRDSPHTPA